MQVWASDNRTEFYRLYSRLIPSEHNLAGFDGGPIVSKSIVEFINPK